MTGIACDVISYGKIHSSACGAILGGEGYRTTDAYHQASDGSIRTLDPAVRQEFGRKLGSSLYDERYAITSLVGEPAKRAGGAILLRMQRTSAGDRMMLARMTPFPEGGIDEAGRSRGGRPYTLIIASLFTFEDWCAHAPAILAQCPTRFVARPVVLGPDDTPLRPRIDWSRTIDGVPDFNHPSTATGSLYAVSASELRTLPIKIYGPPYAPDLPTACSHLARYLSGLGSALRPYVSATIGLASDVLSETRAELRADTAAPTVNGPAQSKNAGNYLINFQFDREAPNPVSVVNGDDDLFMDPDFPDTLEEAKAIPVANARHPSVSERPHRTDDRAAPDQQSIAQLFASAAGLLRWTDYLAGDIDTIPETPSTWGPEVVLQLALRTFAVWTKYDPSQVGPALQVLAKHAYSVDDRPSINDPELNDLYNQFYSINTGEPEEADNPHRCIEQLEWAESAVPADYRKFFPKLQQLRRTVTSAVVFQPLNAEQIDLGWISAIERMAQRFKAPLLPPPNLNEVNNTAKRDALMARLELEAITAIGESDRDFLASLQTAAKNLGLELDHKLVSGTHPAVARDTPIHLRIDLIGTLLSNLERDLPGLADRLTEFIFRFSKQIDYSNGETVYDAIVALERIVRSSSGWPQHALKWMNECTWELGQAYATDPNLSPDELLERQRQIKALLRDTQVAMMPVVDTWIKETAVELREASASEPVDKRINRIRNFNKLVEGAAKKEDKADFAIQAAQAATALIDDLIKQLAEKGDPLDPADFRQHLADILKALGDPIAKQLKSSSAMALHGREVDEEKRDFAQPEKDLLLALYRAFIAPRAFSNLLILPTLEEFADVDSAATDLPLVKRFAQTFPNALQFLAPCDLELEPTKDAGKFPLDGWKPPDGDRYAVAKRIVLGSLKEFQERPSTITVNGDLLRAWVEVLNKMKPKDSTWVLTCEGGPETDADGPEWLLGLDETSVELSWMMAFLLEFPWSSSDVRDWGRIPMPASIRTSMMGKFLSSAKKLIHGEVPAAGFPVDIKKAISRIFSLRAHAEISILMPRPNKNYLTSFSIDIENSIVSIDIQKYLQTRKNLLRYIFLINTNELDTLGKFTPTPRGGEVVKPFKQPEDVMNGVYRYIALLLYAEILRDKKVFQKPGRYYLSLLDIKKKNSPNILKRLTETLLAQVEDKRDKSAINLLRSKLPH